MITKVMSVENLKRIFIETFLNNTNKVTKVSDQSVVNGIAYGVSKISQKALKDIALIESHIFPENAYGAHLDTIATRFGISPRFGASQASTYLRIVGDIGTAYLAGTHTFVGGGITFDLLENVTIGSNGFEYAKVRSQELGSAANVPALTINSITPQLSGHRFCTNEYQALGGRDAEDDVSFRLRIKNGINLAARGTLEYIAQVFAEINSDVLAVYNYGLNAQGQTILAVATQNGAGLTTNELNTLLTEAKQFLNLNQYNGITDNSINVTVINVEQELIDVAFRAELIDTSTIEETRQSIQVAISKYLDWRTWSPDKKVEWDDLLQIVKNDPNVRYVADSYFVPNKDISIPVGKLPRLRGFIMRDLEGNLLDQTNTQSPIYYPNVADNQFTTTLGIV